VESYLGFGLHTGSLQSQAGRGRYRFGDALPRFGEAVSGALWGLQLDPASRVCKMYGRAGRPGKDLLSSNERRSILTRPNGTLRNCVASGANWPWATTRGLRLAGSIFSVRSNYRTASELVVGAQGRDQPCYCRKVGRAKGGRVADLASHYAKFREGLETVDLRLAKQVLNGSYRPDSAINSLH
jgi:hypothetical protein